MLLNMSKKKSLLELEQTLKENIIGQDHVIPTVVRMLEGGEIGIRSAKQPKGSLLFLGPTGVGKTEMALTFTNHLFGEDSLHRFDMAEFMHFDSVKQLIGDETGSSGRLGLVLENSSGGTLLFDEMEKAHPQILDIFMSILDAARVTLGNKKTYNLSNYYVIFTSNIGAKRIPDNVANISTTIENGIKAELNKHLRKEFRARFKDGMIIFNQLNDEIQRKIADRLLSKELKRLEEFNIFLEYDQSVMNYVMIKGIMPEFGVRPLRDTIEKEISNAVCNELLRGAGKKKGVLTEDRENDCLKIK